MTHNPRAVVAGHLVFFAGLFLAAWGLSSLAEPVGPVAVLQKPLWWGLAIATTALHPLFGIGRDKSTARREAEVRALVAGHLVFFAGLFLVAWGLSSLAAPVGPVAVLQRPLWWGLAIATTALHPLFGLGKEKLAARREAAGVVAAPGR